MGSLVLLTSPHSSDGRTAHIGLMTRLGRGQGPEPVRTSGTPCRGSAHIVEAGGHHEPTARRRSSLALTTPMRAELPCPSPCAKRPSAAARSTSSRPGPHSRSGHGTVTQRVDRAQAQDVQDLAVAGALRGIDGSPTLSRQVVEGDAATVLLAMARTADYLVVGAGRGIFGGSTRAGIRDRAVRPRRGLSRPGGSATDTVTNDRRMTP